MCQVFFCSTSLVPQGMVPKNIHTYPKDGSLVWTLPPPGISSSASYFLLKICAIETPIPLEISNDHPCGRCGGLMVSVLDYRSTVRVRALARALQLCSWARHFTLIVLLSTQVYKWVAANLLLGLTLGWTSIPSRGE